MNKHFYVTLRYEGDADTAEQVAEDFLEWVAQLNAKDVVDLAVEEPHTFAPAEGDPGHCAICGEYDSDHVLCSFCGEPAHDPTTACGGTKDGKTWDEGYDPERDDFDDYVDTPEDYEGDRYLNEASVERVSDGNKVAHDGLDRCACGCKYWRNDRCIDCGANISEAVEYDEDIHRGDR